MIAGKNNASIFLFYINYHEIVTIIYIILYLTATGSI